MATKIKYNGATIETLNSGVCTLHLTDKKLTSDIVIMADASGGSSGDTSIISNGQSLTIEAASVERENENTLLLGE